MSLSIPSHSEQELLEQAPPFAGLAPGDLAWLAGQAHRRTVTRGGYFFRQGEPATTLYLVYQGHVRLTQLTPEGHQVVMRLAAPGQLFGGIAVLGETVYPASAEAVDTCRTLAWDGATWAVILVRSSPLALNLLRHEAGRIQELQDRVRELTTERVEQRVARALLRLVRQAGRRVNDGVLIDFALSRQDLAEMTGTTLYSVSRILSQWEEAGVVESSRTRVLVRAPHRLVALAEDLPLRPASRNQDA